MIKRVKFRNFSGGLHLGGGADEIPINHVRRNRGIHPLADKIFKSRNGSTQLHALNNVHSLVYYKDVWYSGASTIFYKETAQVKTGLSGERLSLTKMPPVAGIEDYLFVAGGGELFKVGDKRYLSGTELITNGTMEADSNWANYGSPATNERSTTRVNGDTYSRKFTPDAANEGIQGDAFTTIALSWYTVTCYVYPDDAYSIRIRVRNGANDDWAYNTLQGSLTQDAWNQITFTYQEASGDGGAGAYIVLESDTATSGDYYVDDVSLQNSTVATKWGIAPPAGSPTLAGGAAGNLSGVYKYRTTFKNSLTGTRSNSRTPNLSVLLHCDGADASTTITDDGDYTHTWTAQDNAQLDTAQKKFGTASLLCDGTDDYVSLPHSSELNTGRGLFTIDFWFRIADVLTTKTHGLFQRWDGSDIWALGSFWCLVGTQAANRSTLLCRYVSPTGVIQLYKQSADLFAANTWHHAAIIRGWEGDPNKLAMTLNGVVQDTATYTGEITSTYAFEIGRYTAYSAFSLLGWLDEFRFTRNEALWTSDFTVPTLAEPAKSISVTDKIVNLSGIPQSDDDQVDSVELWRTVGGGAVFFHLDSVERGTATYSDDVDDTNLGATVLPVDNIVPYQYFDDCFGPYNASMFLLSRSQEGERGRLYYSPVGRGEAMQAFINVCGDDAPLQKGVIYKGYIYLFSEGGIYQVYGTNPYYSREVDPVGTGKPHTVIVTPNGIAYEAEDGPRLFDGNRSQIIKPDSVDLIFRGEAVENLSAFSGVVADFGRGEYTISDESQTLAYHFAKRRWRDIGLAFKSLHYAKDADILGGGTASDGIYDIENEGTVHDNVTDLSIALETAHHRIGEDAGGIVKHVHIDANAGSEALTIALVHDGTATTLGTLATSSRSRTTFPANKFCREFGIRITGTIDVAVLVYGADADVYTSKEESV